MRRELEGRASREAGHPISALVQVKGGGEAARGGASEGQRAGTDRKRVAATGSQWATWKIRNSKGG